MKQFIDRKTSAVVLWLVLFSGWVPESGAADFPGETRIDVTAGLKSGDVTFLSTPLDIGDVPALFDGEVKTLARSKDTNPFELIVIFSKPQTVTRFRLWFDRGQHRCKIYAANSLAEMQARKGGYRTVSGGHTDPGNAWAQLKLGVPVTASVWRFELERLKGDKFVHWYELEFYRPGGGPGGPDGGSTRSAPPTKAETSEIAWKTRNGQTLVAKFQAVEGNSVVLSIKGAPMKMALESLSDESRALAEKLGEAARVAGR